MEKYWTQEFSATGHNASSAMYFVTQYSLLLRNALMLPFEQASNCISQNEQNGTEMTKLGAPGNVFL